MHNRGVEEIGTCLNAFARSYPNKQEKGGIEQIPGEEKGENTVRKEIAAGVCREQPP